MTGLFRRPLFHMLPILLLAGLILGACGGGGGDTPVAGTPSPNQQPSPSQQIVTQLVQQGYLKASNTNAGDLLDITVALSGDTLAVGAPER